MFSRMRAWRRGAAIGLLLGLMLLIVGVWAIGLPIFEAVTAQMIQRRSDETARLPVIASAAQLAEARDGDDVLLEGRISPSNTFAALRTWRRQDGQYVVYDAKFAAYWTQRVRPVEGGVAYDPHVIRSVRPGLRVQVPPGAEVTIENADFKTGWDRGGTGAIYGRDLPPLIDLVLGVELGEVVTVRGRLHHAGGRWTMKAEYLDDTTATNYISSLKQSASESGALARGFSDTLWALAFVVGVPCIIGGIFVLRWSYKNL